MKPLVAIALLCLSLNVSAQKWLWVNEAINDTAQRGVCAGDPWSIATDRSGNVISQGIFEGDVFFGSTLVTSNFVDCFVAKYSPSGKVLWAKQSTASSNADVTFAWATATDISGNIFVTGFFFDTVGFPPYTLTNGLKGGYSGERGNVFLVKYDPNGNVLWAQSATISNMTAAQDAAYGVATDASGNVFITGMFTDTMSFGSVKLANTDYYNSPSPYIIKFAPNGNALWGRQGTHNGQYNDVANGIATDGAGNAYIVGSYNDSIRFGATVLPLSGYSGNAFLVKYDPGGNMVWAKSPVLGYISECSGEAITTDGNNSVYITGGYDDTVTFGSSVLTNPSYGNVYMAKYNTSGGVAWAISNAKNNFGATVYSVSASNTGMVYLCGTYFDSISFGGNQLSTAAQEPSFIYKFDSSGKALCATGVNNYNDDENAVAADPLGDNVYFNGDVLGEQCTFGDTTLYGGSEEWAFVGKWTCATCNVIPTINQPDTICAGSSVTLSAGGGTSYLWSPATGLNSATVANPVASPASNTIYYVTVTDGACKATDSVNVVVHPGPVVTLCCDTTIQPGNNVQLNATGGVTYTWSPTYGLSCDNCPNPIANPYNTMTYYVTIRTDSGCSVTEQVTIDVNCGQVFIPDAFSPNGDGKNDMLYVRGDCISTLQFEIFDRWGNKVFETNDKNIGWDGRYKGLPMNTGTYSYYVHAALYDGSNIDIKGSVTLVR